VVGFDGSPASYEALDWGAATAAARVLPLTLLAARPDAAAPVIELADAEEEGLISQEMSATLADAQSRAAQAHPGLTVTTVIHPDSPVEGLLHASTTADLIVIGSRGLGGFAGLLIGSTAMNLAPYADCPVVVQYVPDEETVAARKSARHPNEVVVAFDGSHFAERALVFGLRHAQASGLGVAVVYVTPGSAAGPPEPIEPDSPELSEEAREDLAAAVRITDRHANVPVTFLHGVGRPAGVLIKEASGSPLAVVGARGRGGFAQLMLGSVGLQMLIHAECPVALVRNLPPE
jgi:nucleotide-binding universal stress UspA family protein